MEPTETTVKNDPHFSPIQLPSSETKEKEGGSIGDIFRNSNSGKASMSMLIDNPTKVTTRKGNILKNSDNGQTPMLVDNPTKITTRNRKKSTSHSRKESPPPKPIIDLAKTDVKIDSINLKTERTSKILSDPPRSDCSDSHSDEDLQTLFVSEQKDLKKSNSTPIVTSPQRRKKRNSSFLAALSSSTFNFSQSKIDEDLTDSTEATPSSQELHNVPKIKTDFNRIEPENSCSELKQFQKNASQSTSRIHKHSPNYPSFAISNKRRSVTLDNLLQTPIEEALPVINIDFLFELKSSSEIRKFNDDLCSLFNKPLEPPISALDIEISIQTFWKEDIDQFFIKKRKKMEEVKGSHSPRTEELLSKIHNNGLPLVTIIKRMKILNMRVRNYLQQNRKITDFGKSLYELLEILIFHNLAEKKLSVFLETIDKVLDVHFDKRIRKIILMALGDSNKEINEVLATLRKWHEPDHTFLSIFKQEVETLTLNNTRASNIPYIVHNWKETKEKVNPFENTRTFQIFRSYLDDNSKKLFSKITVNGKVVSHEFLTDSQYFSNFLREIYQAGIDLRREPELIRREGILLRDRWLNQDGNLSKDESICPGLRVLELGSDTSLIIAFKLMKHLYDLFSEETQFVIKNMDEHLECEIKIIARPKKEHIKKELTKLEVSITEFEVTITGRYALLSPQMFKYLEESKKNLNKMIIENNFMKNPNEHPDESMAKIIEEQTLMTIPFSWTMSSSMQTPVYPDSWIMSSNMHTVEYPDDDKATKARKNEIRKTFNEQRDMLTSFWTTSSSYNPIFLGRVHILNDITFNENIQNDFKWYLLSRLFNYNEKKFYLISTHNQ